ncbi:MAG: PqqD family protein [Geminicoccaceae bacterium]
MAQRHRAAADLQFQAMGDGYLVNEAGSDQVHFLNHTAMLVLLLCDGVATAAQIAVELQVIHDLPAPPLTDVEDVLTQLLEQGVIQPAARASGADGAGVSSENIEHGREPAHA